MITLDDLSTYDQTVIAVGGSHTLTSENKEHTTKASNTISKPRTKRKRWKEISIFVTIMSVSAIAGIVFTNLHLFQATIMEDFLGIREQAPTVIASSEGAIIDQKPSIIEATTSNHFYQDTKDHLKTQLASNNLVFNTLPPDNRVIIDDLGVDTPIVDINYYTPEKLENGDFKEELERGVVRYPNTGTPDAGNMLIFGHTSDYWWNNNEFGQIFRNIPKLTEGQIIKVVWNNQMYEYKITTKKIVKPKDVAKTYEQYHSDDKQYITLVGCYPIGTANQRIMIIAERIDTQQNPNQTIQLARYP